MDNCALLTPDMYKLFGYPVLKAIWQAYSPAPNDWRYQHSGLGDGALVSDSWETESQRL